VKNTLPDFTVGAVLELRSAAIPITSGVAYTLMLMVGDGTRVGADQLIWHYATGYINTTSNAARQPPFATGATQAVESGSDSYKFANPATSARCMDPLRGTFLCTFKAGWALADINDVTRAIFQNYQDSSNYELLTWSKPASNLLLKYTVRIGGVSNSYTLDLGSGVAYGDVIKVGVRWQSTDGELDNANHAGKLFAYRNSTAYSQAFTMAGARATGNRTLYYGCTSTLGENCDGWLRDMAVVPYVLSDDEVFRRMGV
jgi:hypothetical protein